MVTVAVCAQAGVTLAQTTPPTTPPPAPPAAFEGSAEFSFVGTSGNSATRTLGTATTLVFRPRAWEITSKASMVRSEDRGTVRAQSTTISTKVARDLTPRLALSTNHKYARDRFAVIDRRNTIEAGLAYDAVDSERHTLTLDAGIGYANEQRQVGRDLSTAIGTGGVSYEMTLSSNASITNEASVVFSLNDSQDRRLANVAGLSAKLTTLFSLKVTHTTRWVRSPVPGFKNTDTITAVALVAKF